MTDLKQNFENSSVRKEFSALTKMTDCAAICASPEMPSSASSTRTCRGLPKVMRDKLMMSLLYMRH